MKEQEARIGNENPTWIDHEVENQGLAKYCSPLVGAYANRIDANNVYFLTSDLIKTPKSVVRSDDSGLMESLDETNTYRKDFHKVAKGRNLHRMAKAVVIGSLAVGLAACSGGKSTSGTETSIQEEVINYLSGLNASYRCNVGVRLHIGPASFSGNGMIGYTSSPNSNPLAINPQTGKLDFDCNKTGTYTLKATSTDSNGNVVSSPESSITITGSNGNVVSSPESSITISINNNSTTQTNNNHGCPSGTVYDPRFGGCLLPF